MRSFPNMLNQKKPMKKPLAEDDMNPVPKGGLKLPKSKKSTYAGLIKEKK